MAEAGEGRGKEKHLSNGCPTDVIDKLEEGRMKTHADEEDEEDGLELSLGLSLHGRFGLDPKKTNSDLMRSSSVSPFMLGGGEEESYAPKMPNIAAYSPISRTCSLPTETEEDRRKRKGLQWFMCMEAKRRRRMMDKFDLEDNSGGEENGYNLPININGQDFVCINGNGDMMPSSQGSIGSQGSSSSGLSEFESQQPFEANKSNEVRKESIEAKKMPKNAMLDMPYVSTVGNGPNGKRIEGFLYRYRKGEEVKIVCVCHGSFLSPAEFVKHAGGTEVEHPLRHIVVNPSAFL